MRCWWNRFGALFAAEIRKRRVCHGSYLLWRWHLYEVFVRINGETHYLWRPCAVLIGHYQTNLLGAVEPTIEVSQATSRRHSAKAAERLSLKVSRL